MRTVGSWVWGGLFAALAARDSARRLPGVAVAALLAPLRGLKPDEAAPPVPSRCALGGGGMPPPPHLQDVHSGHIVATMRPL